MRVTKTVTTKVAAKPNQKNNLPAKPFSTQDKKSAMFLDGL